MMATEKSIPVSEGTTGVLDGVATTAVTRADSSTAYRQEIVIADDTTDAARAKVGNATPGSTDYGLTVRPLMPTDGAAHTEPVGDAVARAKFVVLTDGVSTAAVKAASAAAAATDPAQVVAVSPNNVVKVGDGTTALTMKAASTAAAATDVAAVVSVSPNSPVYHRASDLVVTTLSTAATAVTATLAAPGAGLFHYITRIEIVRVATAAVTGSAVLAYTSTNLPGPWARSAGNAIAIGATVKDVDETLSSPLKSSTVNTATTFVAPSGGTGVQVRITVYYYTAP